MLAQDMDNMLVPESWGESSDPPQLYNGLWRVTLYQR